MSFSDVEHFATVVTGCESIQAGDRSSGDARYAFAVLKLHTVDMGSVAGQEGFLDNVKAGAAKTGEFVKKLFEAIKKWFSETFRSTKSKLASLLEGKEEKAKAAVRDKLRSIVIPKIEALKKAAGEVPSDVKADGFAAIADKAISSLGEGSSAADVKNGMNALLDAVNRVSDSFVGYCNAHMPKKQMDSHAPYDKAVKEYKQWAEKANALTSAITAVFQFKVKGDVNK